MNNVLKIKLLWICVLCIACQHEQKQTNDSVEAIDVQSVGNTYITKDVLQEATTIIPLETADDCLLGTPKRIRMYRDRIFVLDNFDQLYAFDKRGKFLWQIGSRGGGPEEYPEITDFYINTEQAYIGIVCETAATVIRYTLEGKYINRTRRERCRSILTKCEYIKGGKLIFQASNSPESLHNYVIFEEEEMAIDGYYVPHVVKGEKRETFSHQQASNAGRDVFLCTFLSDTIFRYTRHKAEPWYVVKNGLKPVTQEVIKRRGPYEAPIYAFIDLSKRGYSKGIMSLFSTDDVLFISCMDGRGILYNRRNNKYDVQAEQDYGVYENPFFGFVGINGEYVICCFQAEGLLNSREKICSTRIHYPEGMFETLKEDDNPVIVLHDIDKIIENIK